MRRTAKITAARLPLRKASVGATAMRSAYPAWIDAEQGLAFVAHVAVVPRVSAGLMLRPVSRVKSNGRRHSPGVSHGR